MRASITLTFKILHCDQIFVKQEYVRLQNCTLRNWNTVFTATSLHFADDKWAEVDEVLIFIVIDASLIILIISLKLNLRRCFCNFFNQKKYIYCFNKLKKERLIPLFLFLKKVVYNYSYFRRKTIALLLTCICICSLLTEPIRIGQEMPEKDMKSKPKAEDNDIKVPLKVLINATGKFSDAEDYKLGSGNLGTVYKVIFFFFFIL